MLFTLVLGRNISLSTAGMQSLTSGVMTMKLIKVANMNEAIEMHDSVSELGFYDSYENVREDHIQFFSKHPEMASEWYVDADTKDVYSLAIFGGQRIINKHSLNSVISSGSLHVVKMDSDGVIEKIGEVEKSNKDEREFFCWLGDDIYLTEDAA